MPRELRAQDSDIVVKIDDCLFPDFYLHIPSPGQMLCKMMFFGLVMLTPGEGKQRSLNVVKPRPRPHDVLLQKTAWPAPVLNFEKGVDVP